jgi:integrase
MPKHLTGGKFVPVERADGSFVDGRDAEAEAQRLVVEKEVGARAHFAGLDNPVRLVLDRYLQWLRGKGTTTDHIQNNVRFYKEFLARWPELRVKNVKVDHFRVWFADKPNWGSSYQHRVGQAFKTAFRWAAGVEGGNLIPKSPLEGWRLPSVRSRGAETLITEEDHQKLLEAASADLRDVLVVLRAVGTRPVNLWRTTAENLYRDRRMLILGEWNAGGDGPAHKTADKTGRPLVVPLTPKAYEVCVRLADRYPEGPLFRTRRGLPWTSNRLARSVYKLTRRTGVKAIAYGYRHTRATELLLCGTPDAEVAAILGHTNTAMLYKHYSHLSNKMEKLRDRLTALEEGSAAETGTPPVRLGSSGVDGDASS